MAIPKKIWANSGDSHFLEPPDLFDERLPKALADRMPKSQKFDGYEIVTVDGQQFRRNMPKPGNTGETMSDIVNKRAPGANDPVLRLQDLDEEGIWAEVTFPSIGIWASSIKSRELMASGVAALNDWAKEYIMDASPRLLPTASVSLLDVDDAVAEVRRCAAMGYRAAFLPTAVPPGQKPYHYIDYWNPLWTALEETNTVLAFHIGTEPVDADKGFGQVFRGPGGAVLNYTQTTFGGQISTMQMITSGALDQHPDLRILVSEGGATWGPFLGDRMNEGYRQHGKYVRPQLSKPPKQFLYEQVYASFQHDETAVGAMQHLGWNNVMWGSDYPHLEGTYGHTQKTLHELFDDAPDDVRRRITVGAFQDLFPEVGEPPADEY
ncbi:amidohydrolase family protein [Pseudonocardia kunmingensis]|uniref:Putative TIM-barrel fold metal-dependent hydrolase n=1 Tax=Pseudonocardia kunmingensis TaxID=630975 RepID=A0A543DPH6_9PSEU|nr:amidohydrolase family protein [Pseudonocardia kunmingensis]TQM11229.1 putative TIM-barrel fold metal-dependent hydrolase [Pseudonocardia kunmingensis]